jgi:soluble lytic murein transglycosylase
MRMLSLPYLSLRFSLAALCFGLVCVIVTSLPVASAGAGGQELSEQRRAYVAASEAIRADSTERFAQLRAQLDGYPLAIYLDYDQLVRRINTVSADEAAQFLALSADTPLANRFLGKYLRASGKRQRWDDFLAARAEEPNSADLKCYFFRAQLAQGDKEAAWAGAAGLWVEGKSQPRECDPLFAAWRRDGQLTDAMVWQRLLNAFEAREESLLQYVATQSSPALRPATERLLAVYQEPQTVTRQAQAAGRHRRAGPRTAGPLQPRGGVGAMDGIAAATVVRAPADTPY